MQMRISERKIAIEQFREEVKDLPLSELKQMRLSINIHYATTDYKTHQNLVYKEKLRILTELISRKYS